MAYTPGIPKGKDAKIGNEQREPKKGLSKTEIQAMMKKMMGNQQTEALSPSPLMPNAKGGARGRMGPLR
jgi:hypothetical protein